MNNIKILIHIIKDGKKNRNNKAKFDIYWFIIKN